MSVFDHIADKQRKEREQARKKRGEDDPYYKRALELTEDERNELIRKSNQEVWSFFTKTYLTDDERQLLYRVRAVKYEDGDDLMESAAVATLLGGMAVAAGGGAAVGANQLLGWFDSVVKTVGSLLGKQGTTKFVESLIVKVGVSVPAAKKSAKVITDFMWGKNPTAKQKKAAQDAVRGILDEVGKKSPRKECPAGKILNPKTNKCIKDTVANRKKLGLPPTEPAQIEEQPTQPKQPKQPKQPSAWLAHVKAYYTERKKDDPDYKWSDAMKDAKESYKT